MNCGTDIPPEFKAAVATNKCPACNGEIMNDASLQLMEELKRALEEMPNDPQGLAGWLLSNYEMRKVGEAKPVNVFFGEKRSSGGGPTKNMKIRNNPLKQFNTKDGKDYGKLAQQINVLNEINDDSYDNSEAEAEYEEETAQQNHFRQYIPKNQPKIKRKEVKQAREPEELDENDDYVKNAVAVMNQSYGDNDTMEQMRMLNNMINDHVGIEEPDGTEDLHPALQQDRMSRLQKQQDLSLGGSVGKISRSG